jgi:hypothetical protein
LGIQRDVPVILEAVGIYEFAVVVENYSFYCIVEVLLAFY